MLGAAGFIGRALSARLAARGVPLRAVTRATSGALGPHSDWPALLDGAEIVVHLATAASPRLDQQRFGDEIATAEALGRAARRSGVRRLILMSSIRAMGESGGAEPFRADTAPAPGDAYGRGKLAIEQALADAPGLAVLRPPLVYGPGVVDSFLMLLETVARGLPLPLASIRNRRAFLYLDNLLDVIAALFPAAAPAGIYLLRDAEEIATPDLVRRIARLLGRGPRLLPCPPALLRGGLSLIGRAGIAAALIGSLSIDDSATRARLGWSPRVGLDDGLAATCRWFREAAR